MRRIAQALVIGLAAVAHAADVTVPFTAGQNTYTRNTLIPQANAKRCLQYNLNVGCTGAAVVSAGCVAEPFSAVTKTNLVFRSCAIYTQDAAGEQAYQSDNLYEYLVRLVAADLAEDVAASCAAFKALSGASQNSICSTLGRPNGCRICP
jgi:hypothetical protein